MGTSLVETPSPRSDRARAAGAAAQADALDAADAAVAALVHGPEAGVPSDLDPALRYPAFAFAVAAPELRELAPLVAAQVVVRLLGVFAGAPAASLHLDDAGRIAGFGDVEDSMALAVPVHRFGKSAATLFVAQGAADEAQAEAFAHEAADAIGALLERDLLLERNAQRERAITGSLEKRLTRLAFDLHDGPLQDLAALGADLSRMRKQLSSVVAEDDKTRVAGRFDDIHARLGELDRTLRDVVDSVHSGGSGLDSVERRIAREVAVLREETGLDAHVDVQGDFACLTDSRRIALFRIVQEALANVREHSGASRVSARIAARNGRVEVSVEDDGKGFDLQPTLELAGRTGRFGLIGMRERVRLLGGDLQIRTTAGSGTCVSFALEPWDGDPS